MPCQCKARCRPSALTVTVELPPLHRIAVLDELAVTALGSVIVAGRGRGAAIGIGHRVGVSPRSMAERAVPV